METSRWQTELCTIRERNEYAFNKSLFCDVEFSVVDSNGDKVTIPANKYILAVSSPVFEAMFYGQFTESNKSIIDLPDCTKEGLQEMLRYLYSDEVNLNVSNITEVLNLAEMYMLPFLANKCKEYVENELRPEDVLCILPQVSRMGDEKLEEHCWGLVDGETQRVVSSESFLNVSREMLYQILVRDTLQVTELQLFQAVNQWVDTAITEQGLNNSGEARRAILGEEGIKLIRFPLMSQKDFAQAVLPCGILDKDEIMEVFQIFSNISPLTTMFNAKERRSGYLFTPSIRFTMETEEPEVTYWHYFGCVDAIEFTINKAVYLVAVKMFGNPNSNYDVELNIYKDNQTVSQVFSSILTENEKINDLYYGYTINLVEPVKLVPHVFYTVEAKISGPPSLSGCGRVPEVEGEPIKITYKDSVRSTNGTSVDDGQFPTFVFKII